MPYKNKSDRIANAEKWNKENPLRVKEIQAKSKRDIYIRNRNYVKNIKENGACADCGNKFHFAAMDFDHLKDKTFNVSHLVKNDYSIKKIEEEIAKCDLVCSNCHRIRTHERMETAGSNPDVHIAISITADGAGIVPQLG